MPLRLPRSPDAVASSRGRPRLQWASPVGAPLGNAIGGIFGNSAAKAAETPPARAAEPAAETASDERGGFLDDIFDGGDDED